MSSPSPGTSFGEAMTESVHELTPVAAAPVLVTLQPIVTVAGSPTVRAGALTFETARSG